MGEGSTELQQVRLPGSSGMMVLVTIAGAGGVAALAGTMLAIGGLVGLGIVLATFAALMALGLLVSRKKVERGVAAMRAGEHFGSWGGDGRPRVDVGASLAIVDGQPKLYAIHFERALGVEIDDAAGELRFKVTSNDGNGSVEVTNAVPFAPPDRERVRVCGQRLAAHHGVELTGPP